MKLPVIENILNANDKIARENRALLDRAKIFAVNVMASPGAGKTSVILQTAQRLPPQLCPGVIEGDLASRLDADAVAARGIPVVQINTGGGCHLDAPMLGAGLAQLPLAELDLLFIENVGNLVCPANFALGAHLALVVASVPEGHDKPYKYPGMFAAADAVLLNKFDLQRVFDFDVEFFKRGLRMVNPHAPLFCVSCKTDAGMAEWRAWLLEKQNAFARQE
ncbi:hydrogenase nickel incorporation protein HypB [Anaerolineae bacterium CFX7]|nr:hydrogenase nickel incorporation protein HypB [Anaerolineae bacterium CFX7]